MKIASPVRFLSFKANPHAKLDLSIPFYCCLEKSEHCEKDCVEYNERRIG